MFLLPILLAFRGGPTGSVTKVESPPPLVTAGPTFTPPLDGIATHPANPTASPTATTTARVTLERSVIRITVRVGGQLER